MGAWYRRGGLGLWGKGYAGQELGLDPETGKILMKFGDRTDPRVTSDLNKLFRKWNTVIEPINRLSVMPGPKCASRPRPLVSGLFRRGVASHASTVQKVTLSSWPVLGLDPRGRDPLPVVAYSAYLQWISDQVRDDSGA